MFQDFLRFERSSLVKSKITAEGIMSLKHWNLRPLTYLYACTVSLPPISTIQVAQQDGD